MWWSVRPRALQKQAAVEGAAGVAFAFPCCGELMKKHVWDLVSAADMPGKQVTLPNPASVSLPETCSCGTWLPRQAPGDAAKKKKC